MADSFQLKAILSAVDKMSPVLKQMQTQAQATRKYLSDLGSAAKSVSGHIGLPITALAGLLTGFGFGAIKKAMEGYSDAGEDIYKGSLRAGLAVEQYQRLKYVFEQSGVEVGAMEMAMGRLNKGIGSAAAGKGKDLLGLLQKLHIPLRDNNGQMRSAADMLPAIADAFVRNENPVVRARMGFALFGKQWAEVVPLLTEGSKGIDALTARFARLKGVMSADDAKGAKDWGDLMKDLSVVTKGFQNTIAKELVPVLSPVVDDLIMWAAANKKLVAAEVKVFVKDVVASLRGFDWAGLVEGVRGFGAGLKSMVDMVGGTRNALIALVVLMNMTAIASFVQLGMAVFRLAQFLKIFGALGWVFTLVKDLAMLAYVFLGPWALLIAALAVGAVAVVAHWKGVKEWFSGFFTWVGDKWAKFTEWVRGAADAARDFLGIERPGSAPNTGGATGAWGDPFAGRPSLNVGTGMAQVGGEIRVKFEDAPPGMRVVQTPAQGGVTINPDVGYRSLGSLGTGTY